MGYSWEGRKLVCDLCGTAGARKVRCPFGYCPPIAACVGCRSSRTDALGRDAHGARGCEHGAARCREREAREREVLAQGHYVRCAARTHGPGLVKVWFRNQARQETCLLVPKATYDAFSLLAVVTIEDYASHCGHVLDAAPAADVSGHTEPTA